VSQALVAVDTGGTFTDLVAWDGEHLTVEKVPSTPDDPARAVIEGLARLAGGPLAECPVTYGSTVATNALLERRGADTALVTTAGFEDVLELARQDRPDIYALHPRRPPPLVPAARRFGVAERLGPDGAVERALEPADAAAVAARVVESGCGSVAVCLLHSYADGAHEAAVEAALREADFAGPVALSHRVLPEVREYERTATTCVQAYVAPKMDAHLTRLEGALAGRRLRVAQSNGGVLAAAEARAHAVRTLLSGPAGGVTGAGAVARAAGRQAAVTLDMGGTSTDVAVWAGEPEWTAEARVGGLPVRVPMLDIHTVGAGGGSVARRDPGGALAVGPRSAGAVPGPACYGLGGDRPTVTDAHLVLGRLVPDRFLGGAMRLDVGAARRVVGELAGELGLTEEAVAEGVLRVANATMERAIKVITLERGRDPRGHALLSFGGAGGLHAASLAEALGLTRVVVPEHPGLLSAFGFLQSDLVRDASRSVLLGLPPDAEALPEAHSSLAGALAELEAEVEADLARMGAPRDRVRLQRTADLRYEGQSWELTVPLDGAVAAFHAAHARRYGTSHEDRPLELVTVRVRGLGETDKPPLPARPLGDEDPAPALVVSDHPCCWRGAAEPTPVYERSRLQPGNVLAGPALVCEYSSTTALPPGWRAGVDGYGSLVLQRGAG